VPVTVTLSTPLDAGCAFPAEIPRVEAVARAKMETPSFNSERITHPFADLVDGNVGRLQLADRFFRASREQSPALAGVALLFSPTRETRYLMRTRSHESAWEKG
jgi:hypothetical protein